MALKPITKYNGYDCEKDPRRLFTPLELAQLARIDRRIDSLPPTAFAEHEPEPPKRRLLMPEERIQHRRANQARWRAQNHERKTEQNRIYRETHRDEIKARIDARRDIINARRRERRKITKEVAL